MGIKKFLNSVKESLGLNKFEKTGKKKSIKRILEKLRARKEILNKVPKKKLNKKEKKELKEELVIISLHIKKGEKILDELNLQNTKNSKK
jgi:cobalamin biosynthesis Co2+ chelatase CbiK